MNHSQSYFSELLKEAFDLWNSGMDLNEVAEELKELEVEDDMIEALCKEISKVERRSNRRKATQEIAFGILFITVSISINSMNGGFTNKWLYWGQPAIGTIIFIYGIWHYISNTEPRASKVLQ